MRRAEGEDDGGEMGEPADGDREALVLLGDGSSWRVAAAGSGEGALRLGATERLVWDWRREGISDSRLGNEKFQVSPLSGFGSKFSNRAPISPALVRLLTARHVDSYADTSSV